MSWHALSGAVANSTERIFGSGAHRFLVGLPFMPRFDLGLHPFTLPRKVFFLRAALSAAPHLSPGGLCPMHKCHCFRKGPKSLECMLVLSRHDCKGVLGQALGWSNPQHLTTLVVRHLRELIVKDEPAIGCSLQNSPSARVCVNMALQVRHNLEHSLQYCTHTACWKAKNGSQKR